MLNIRTKVTFHNPIYAKEKIKISGVIFDLNEGLRVLNIKLKVINIKTHELKSKGNIMQDPILIIGATGTIGSRVAQNLKIKNLI